MEKKAVAVGKVAKIIGVHPQTIRRWIANGDLQAWKTPGNQRRVNLEDVEKLMKVEK